mgnify:CR=1 FL=1
MKLGEEPKGIIAHGHVVKGPYLENETYYVDIEFDSIQNANDEKEIISLTELKNKFKIKNTITPIFFIINLLFYFFKLDNILSIIIFYF